MITLALDTSTAGGSIAVRRDGATIVARAGDVGRPHATRLPGDLVDALAECGPTLDDVSLLAVGLGPGAFTGLRVGLATIQGLAFARNLPVVGISALDAIASAAASRRETTSPCGSTARGRKCSPRGIAASRRHLFGVEALGDPIAAPPEAVLSEWARRGWPRAAVWVGEGRGDSIVTCCCATSPDAP